MWKEQELFSRTWASTCQWYTIHQKPNWQQGSVHAVGRQNILECTHGITSLATVTKSSLQCVFVWLQKRLQCEWIHLYKLIGSILPAFELVEEPISNVLWHALIGTDPVEEIPPPIHRLISTGQVCQNQRPHLPNQHPHPSYHLHYQYWRLNWTHPRPQTD